MHLIGLAGVGMRALANLLVSAGYQVSGSDLRTSTALKYLESIGVKVMLGHQASNVDMAEIVVRSSAILDTHVEWRAARAKGCKLMHRSAMLEKLCQGREVIAVTGTHGKTSTTAMIAHALQFHGLQPSFAIGSDWGQYICGSHLANGSMIVLEADESDASFLQHTPKIGVILNLEREHMSFYQQSEAKLHAAFAEFMQNSAEIVYCGQDPALVKLQAGVDVKARSYGLGDGFDITIVDLGFKNGRQFYRLSGVEGDWPIVGSHQLQNLAAAFAACRHWLSLDAFVQAMQVFQLPGRRFSELGYAVHSSTLVIDDYGHHPRELAATIAAVRLKYPNKRLVMAFQPHKYTRLRDEFSEFVRVLAMADFLVLLPVYAAGETSLPGFTSFDLWRELSSKLAKNVQLMQDLNSAQAFCAKILTANDLLLCQGAGDITLLAQNILEQTYV